jgi:exonuclease-1
MRAFHTKGIDYMVAPYESDSQIAKLIHLGLADFAITEDSDLVVYGVKVVLKLTQDGECDYIDLNRWTSEDVDSLFLKQYLKLDYIGRLESAILSGSDYNHSVKGIGIKRAVKNIYKLKNMNNVIEYLRGVKPYSDKVPEDY